MPAHGLKTNKETVAEYLGDKYRPVLGSWKYFVKNVKDKKRKPGTPIPERQHLNVLRWPGMENYDWDYVGTEGYKGVYPYADLSTAEYDAMFIKSGIDTKRFDKEADLMKTKWFDYRFMHFMESTYLFTRHYVDAYRRMYRKIWDHKSYKCGFEVGDDHLPKGKTHKAGIFMARAKADELGIPYWFWCNFAMKWAVEDRIWNMPPKPNQLYKPEMVEAINDAWKDRCKITLQVPYDQRYLLETGIDGEPQQDFQKWLCGQILMRAHPERGLNSYMNLRPMISKQNALEYMGERHFNAAMRIYRNK